MLLSLASATNIVICPLVITIEKAAEDALVFALLLHCHCLLCLRWFKQFYKFYTEMSRKRCDDFFLGHKPPMREEPKSKTMQTKENARKSVL